MIFVLFRVVLFAMLFVSIWFFIGLINSLILSRSISYDELLKVPVRKVILLGPIGVVERLYRWVCEFIKSG